MNLAIFIAFAVAILATTLFESKSVRVIATVLIIVVGGVVGFFHGLGQFYNRGYIAASVVSLAKQSSGEGSDKLIEEAEEFRRSFRAERILESGSGMDLWSAIKKKEQLDEENANRADMATPSKPSD